MPCPDVTLGPTFDDERQALIENSCLSCCTCEDSEARATRL